MKKRNWGIALILTSFILISSNFCPEFIPGILPCTTIARASSATELGKPAITELDNLYKGIVIKWGAVKNAEGYNIYRRMKSTQDWTLLASVPATERTYTDTDTPKENGLYTYMVRAYRGEKLSAESASKTIVRVNITRVSLNVTFKQKNARTMQKLINDFRTGADAWAWNSNNTQKVYVSGLSKLAYDYNLEKIAMLRAAEVAIKFAHERPNGKQCFTALNENGYVYTAAGENIAYNCKTVNAAFKAFQESNNQYANQTHRRMMLSPDYNVCAVGHARVNGTDYWVKLFANTQDDSDYTKTKNGETRITLDIASEDIPSYKKTFNKLDVKYKDYKPAKITVLTTEATKRSATLTFERSRGAQGYEIYRSNAKKGNYSLVKRITSQDKLTFTDKKLSGKKKYYYYVVPYRLVHDDYVYGKKSNVVMIKTH